MHLFAAFLLVADVINYGVMDSVVQRPLTYSL